MKKILLSLLILLPLISYSQIDKPIKKGNINMGGNGSISKLNFRDSNDKIFSAYINPACNYFLIDNLATGLTASLGYNKINGVKSTSYGIGPNIKYYLNNGILLRAESLISKSTGNTSDTKTFTFKSGIGYAIFINSKVSIEPVFLYYYGSMKSNIFERDLGGYIIPAMDYSAKENTLIFEIGFSFFL
jgi:hypothetical protein